MNTSNRTLVMQAASPNAPRPMTRARPEDLPETQTEQPYGFVCVGEGDGQSILSGLTMERLDLSIIAEAEIPSQIYLDQNEEAHQAECEKVNDSAETYKELPSCHPDDMAGKSEGLEGPANLHDTNVDYQNFVLGSRSVSQVGHQDPDGFASVSRSRQLSENRNPSSIFSDELPRRQLSVAQDRSFSGKLSGGPDRSPARQIGVGYNQPSKQKPSVSRSIQQQASLSNHRDPSSERFSDELPRSQLSVAQDRPFRGQLSGGPDQPSGRQIAVGYDQPPKQKPSSALELGEDSGFKLEPVEKKAVQKQLRWCMPVVWFLVGAATMFAVCLLMTMTNLSVLGYELSVESVQENEESFSNKTAPLLPEYFPTPSPVLDTKVPTGIRGSLPTSRPIAYTKASTTQPPTTLAPSKQSTTIAPTTQTATFAPVTLPSFPVTQRTTSAPDTQPTTSAPVTQLATSTPTTQPTTSAPVMNPPTTQPPERSTSAPTASTTQAAEWEAIAGPFIGLDTGHGTSVAIAGEFMVAGEPFRSSVGQVSIYREQNLNLWTQVSSLVDMKAHKFGSSLDMCMNSGKVSLLIGAKETEAEVPNTGNYKFGSASYYEMDDNGAWSRLGSIQTPHKDIFSAGGEYGFSVAMASIIRRFAVAAPESSMSGYLLKSGKIFTYEYNGTDWVPMASEPLHGKVNETKLGTSLAMSTDGSYLLAGAAKSRSGDGSAFYYEWENDTKSWESIFSFPGESGEALGTSAAIVTEDGNMIAIGGPSYGANQGVIKVFQQSGGIFTQLPDIVGSDNERIGATLTGAQGRVAFGTDSGSFHVYEYSGQNWEEVAAGPSTGSPVVSIDMKEDGKTVVVGLLDEKSKVYRLQHLL